MWIFWLKKWILQAPQTWIKMILSGHFSGYFRKNPFLKTQISSKTWVFFQKFVFLIPEYVLFKNDVFIKNESVFLFFSKLFRFCFWGAWKSRRRKKDFFATRIKFLLWTGSKNFKNWIRNFDFGSYSRILRIKKNFLIKEVE